MLDWRVVDLIGAELQDKARARSPSLPRHPKPLPRQLAKGLLVDLVLAAGAGEGIEVQHVVRGGFSQQLGEGGIRGAGVGHDDAFVLGGGVEDPYEGGIDAVLGQEGFQ